MSARELTRRLGTAAALMTGTLCSSARAGEIEWPGASGDGVVIDHQPHPFGGLGSDTLFREFPGGPAVWQRVADDIVLDSPALIRRIHFWGFYGSTFDSEPEPPPLTETMRIRFYDARPSDGLPQNVLFEDSFSDPMRTATGDTIPVGPNAPEYFFEVNLTVPFLLNADTPYWLEIVQIDDVDSHFRWEFSLAEQNGFAFVNSLIDDWRYTQSITSDTAFQLLTIPEPNSVGLIALGALLLLYRRRKEV